MPKLMPKKTGPRCRSKQIEMREDIFIKCDSCGYDEREGENGNFHDQRNSQREKAKYNPYKTGRKFKK